MKTTFRVYAKIIGHVLPGNENVRLYGCVLRKMSMREQERRHFKAIEVGIKDPGDPRFHKSYITRKIFNDPRYIKTQYVIYCDVKVYDENAALGMAVRLFDNVSGSLALVASSWFNKKHNRNDYHGYEYQLCKVYKLDTDGKEISIGEPQINGGGWSMICYPGVKDFKVLDSRMLTRILKCDDEIFKKAFKYLLQAEQDYYKHVPPEMLTINLFKCIELIINSFEGRKFKNKLKHTAKELKLNNEDIEKIKTLKKARDDGDVAHPKKGSPSAFYPPQFPVPGDVDFPNFWYSGLTSKILVNYFLYIDSLVFVNTAADFQDDIDVISSVNLGKYYVIKPSVRGRRKRVLLIKKKISEYFNIPYAKIVLKKFNSPDIIFQVKDHLKFDLKT